MNAKIAVRDAFLHAIEIEKLGSALYVKLEKKAIKLNFEENFFKTSKL